ncbi:hypothetical protein [Indiicoccus explosivorum]|uniref:hypothetical protein n=1 Tax=Indiicoccus explosivorum TaxID=1917864 RepID=UPI000B42D4D1|nr:hypothetical protein [Indiicoccus explosivorum]
MRPADQAKVQKLYRQKMKLEKEKESSNRDLLVIMVFLLLIVLYDVFNLPFDTDTTVMVDEEGDMTGSETVIHSPAGPRTSERMTVEPK